MTFPRRSFLQQNAFHAGDEAYSWQDVFYAARLTGDWRKLEEQTARSIACRNKFGQRAVSDDEIERACEEFRYERDLITAEELESWLDRKELTMDEWFDYIERRLLLDKFEEEIAADDSGFMDPGFFELLEIDGICSGELRRLAYQLSGQVALYASDHKASIPESDADLLLRMLPADVQKYPGIEKLIHLKLNFEKYESEQITEEQIQEAIQSQPLDFIRFELRMLTFSDQSQASEGALCIREDKDRPSDISRLAGAKLENTSGYLSDFNPSYRDELTAAQPGESIGPLPTSAGQYVLIYVASKNLPSIEDEDVRMRAKRKLLQSALDYEINNRIQWQRL